jgi:hypothetical protein
MFKAHRRTMALAGIALAGIYIGVCVQLRERSEEHLSRFTSQIAGVQRQAVLPNWFDPLGWSGIVETDTDVFIVAIGSFKGVTAELARFPRGVSSAVTEGARAAYAAEIFRGFARFPVIQVEELDSAWRVLMADVRFHQPGTERVFGAEITLDRSLRVIREEMGFSQRISARPAGRAGFTPHASRAD